MHSERQYCPLLLGNSSCNKAFEPKTCDSSRILTASAWYTGHAIGSNSTDVRASTSVRSSSRSTMAAASPKPTVLVTGASGKTGKLIAQKVKSSDSYSLRALFRTDQVRLPFAC